MIIKCRRCPSVGSVVEASLTRDRDGLLHAKDVSISPTPPDVTNDVQVLNAMLLGLQ